MITDYRDIFLNNRPMMDTRAPLEFSKGSFPGAVNLPLMSDIERERVGTCYKKQGQEAAITLGHKLVSGAIKDDRIAQWRQFALNNPDGLLYCARGGLRSKITQQWLKEAGVEYPRVNGGYKAMRTFLLDTIEQASTQCGFVVLGGMTGCGKTSVLTRIGEAALDLEGHANHRGSSFGMRATEQPSIIDFENRLAIDLLKKRAKGIERFVVEDESRMIGSCSVPLALYSGMKTCPMVWLEDSFESRVERILNDYVVDLASEFVQVYGAEQGHSIFAKRLTDNLGRIKKRLGPDRFQRINALMQQALDKQSLDHGNVDLHRGWIQVLLCEYYDPMYIFQRESKSSRIQFSGDQSSIIDYLKDRLL
eukprot:gene20812-24997_t